MHLANAVAQAGGGIVSPVIIAKVVAKILGSQNPEGTLLDAITHGVIPGEVGLDLAEVFGKVVRVSNLENLVETVVALSRDGTISSDTAQVLLLAIIEIAEEENGGQVEIGNKPLETAPATSAVPESQQTTPKTSLTDLVRSATELLQEFSAISAIPADTLAKIRQTVEKLTPEDFASLRQSISSAIIAQAELTNKEEVDVSQSLEVLEILFDQQQMALTAAVYTVYETLFSEGFRLQNRNRDEYDRPLMTITSVNLLRNCFRKWLDSHESGLDASASKLAMAEKAVTKLERFLVVAGHEHVREAISSDIAVRLRERIILSGVRVHNAINHELVAALPQTKEDALTQVSSYLETEVAKLGLCLRVIGSKALAEANSAFETILLGHAACVAWRQKLEELESSDYNPADQLPVLSAKDRRLAFFEVERKELDSICIELEKQIKTSQGAKTTFKKLEILRAITASKIEDIDDLITPLRHRPPRETTINRNIGSIPPPMFILPPLLLTPALAKKASHG